MTANGLEISDVISTHIATDKLAINSDGYLKCQGELVAINVNTSAEGRDVNLTIGSNMTVNKTLYTASGTVSKSDRDSKNSIKPFDIYESATFIYSLIPSQYKYNNGTSNRYHHGFIAQEVKLSMGDRDWGLYVDENPDVLGNKGLRDVELIADLVATVQSQNERISNLERQLI